MRSSPDHPVTLLRRRFLHLAAGAVALTIVSQLASAQTYPSRPVSMIVPYPPGGPTDTLGRIFAERMRVSLGQPVIVENIGGAAGTIGTARALRAVPDGYTINFSNVASHVFSSIVYKLQYDVLKDLEPVALLTISPLWLVASNNVPASNVRELIAWLKANADSCAARATDAGRATRLSHVGNRQMAADHRGRQHQAGVGGRRGRRAAGASPRLRF
jgi:tripartite-type tricarboxylate transporter receptor subunit TctC